MILSHGGVTGGLTIADALAEFEARGYLGQFIVRPDAHIECMACHTMQRPRDVPVEAARRIEGASDPADMAFVGALRCPHCGRTGTAVIPFGPGASPEDGQALRELSDHRHSAWLSDHGPSDGSLVHDSGWLSGPDGP